MLVLSRKRNEQVRIGKDVLITVTHVGKGSVKLGITAPKETSVLRGEIEVKDTGDDSGKKQVSEGQ